MKKNGFTLIELMVVITIIGLISSIALPRFVEITNSAKVANVQGNLSSMRTAIGMYNVKTGEYPRESQIIRNNNGEGPDLDAIFGGTDTKSREYKCALSDFFSKTKFSKTPAFFSNNIVEIYETAEVIYPASNYRTGNALYPFTPGNGTGGWIYREGDGALRAYLAKGAYGNSKINCPEF
ncbi:hypothetical protein PM10SUCC1_10700 [Propionigenium maris DSM 9537]|uniref:Prepilin-type N-terminal cleavage/methylation domain-containing protein n=1 Tax=Propionigenium maris DSM 9537 TaxID=1123000 RepID=A0A9W6GKN2_9FUSO|nr:prepilin-type N-terminal cleavage/methylation domain-containing protein [Propionigenium maris]GLI55556.1 hypothetical protein PM10SUCC1_10700 [Propionigenium maris DSM 9537]